MRQKRAKTYRKALALYMRHFAFRLPLQLLFDSALVLALAKQRLAPADVPARLAGVLQVRAAAPLGHRRPKAEGGEVKCMITQCAINELYRRQKDGDVEARAVDMAKTFERRRCGHREAIAGDECVRQSMGEWPERGEEWCGRDAAARDRSARPLLSCAMEPLHWRSLHARHAASDANATDVGLTCA